MKTVFDLTAQERRVLYKLTVERLQQRHGFTYLPATNEETTRKRKTEQSTLFGNYLDDLAVIYTPDCGFVPLFLYQCISALSHFIHLEGIFRKAGSIQRQKELRNCVEQGRAVNIGDISLAYDTACLIKQFLRELPEPIFTESLASCYLQSAHTPQTLLLLSLLLPPAHLSTLKYVCCFLKAVSERSEQNKMSTRNLALVFSPSLFPNEPIRLNSNPTRSSLQSAQFHGQITVLETLIAHADQLGQLSAELVDAVQSSKSADDRAQFAETYDAADTSVPSRKRKSRGSIHGLFSELSHSIAKLRRTSFGVTKDLSAVPKEDSFADTLIKELSVCVAKPSASASASVCEQADSSLRPPRRSHTPQRRTSMDKFESGAQVVRFRKSLDGQAPEPPTPTEGSTPKRSLPAAAAAPCVPPPTAQETLTPKVKPQMANVDVLLSKTTLCRALQASNDRKRICLTHDDRRPAVQVNLV